MMEVRWMNSDVLVLDGVDRLVAKKKKVRMVKNKWIAEEFGDGGSVLGRISVN